MALFSLQFLKCDVYYTLKRQPYTTLYSLLVVRNFKNRHVACVDLPIIITITSNSSNIIYVLLIVILVIVCYSNYGTGTTAKPAN